MKVKNIYKEIARSAADEDRYFVEYKNNKHEYLTRIDKLTYKLLRSLLPKEKIHES